MIRLITKTVGLTALVFAGWLLLISQFVVFNASWSAPHWGYARLPDLLVLTGYPKGAWVQFRPEVQVPGLVKQIVGVAGDKVEVDADRQVW